MNWITYWIDHASKIGSKLKIFDTGCIPDKKKRCTHCGMKFDSHLNEGGFEYCPQVKKSEETTINKTSRPLPPPSATPKKELILSWMQRNKHLFEDIEKQQTFHLYLIQNFRTTVMTDKEFNSHFLNWQESEHKKKKEEKRKIHFENFGITGCAVDDFKGWLTWNNISESSINSSVVCLYNTQKEKERKAQQETINEIKLKDYFDSLKRRCADLEMKSMSYSCEYDEEKGGHYYKVKGEIITPKAKDNSSSCAGQQKHHVVDCKAGDIKKTWLIYSDDIETMNAARNPKVNFAVWMECRRMQQDKTCTFDTQTTINLLKAMDLDPALYPTTSKEPIQERVQPTNDNSTNA